MVTAKAPVTLVLAGEWASREEGNGCLASAINKNIVVTVEASDVTKVSAPAFGVDACSLTDQHTSSMFIIMQRAVTTTLAYLTESGVACKTVALVVNTDNVSVTQKNGDLHWIDLNMHAATAVAIVKALLVFHEKNVTSAVAKLHIFKLAFIALYGFNDDHGYGADIAASTYGATVLYQHASAAWTTKHLAAIKGVYALVDKQWTDLKITAYNMPDDLKLCVCFVEQQKPLLALAEKVAVYKQAYPIRYRQLCASINMIVKDLVQAIQKHDKQTILSLVKQNKQLLKHLLEEAGSTAQPPTLTTLISCAEDCGAAAKFAGISDTGYGFALCLDRFTAQKVKRKWEKKGMSMLNTQILG